MRTRWSPLLTPAWRCTQGGRNLGAFGTSISGWRRGLAPSRCLGLGSLYSHAGDGKSAGFRLLDTSLLGEPLWANLAAACRSHGQCRSQEPAPTAAGSDHLSGRAVPGRRVAEHEQEVQQLCEALEQQIQQEQQRLEQEVGHRLLLSPWCSPKGGPSTPEPPWQLPDRWVGACQRPCCHCRAWPGATSMAWSCSERWTPARGRCSAWSRRRWR